MENSNQPPTAGVGIRREPSTDPVKAQGILTSVIKKEKHAARLWQQRWSFLSRIQEIQEEEAQRRGGQMLLHISSGISNVVKEMLEKYVLGHDFDSQSRSTVSCRTDKKPFKSTQCYVIVFNTNRIFPEDIQKGKSFINGKLWMSLDEYRAAVRSVSCKPEKEIAVEIEPSSTPLPFTSSGIIGRRALYSLEKFGPSVKTPRDFPIRPRLASGQIYDPYKQTLMFLGSVEGDPISYKLAPARSEVSDEMWTQPQRLNVALLSLDKLADQQ